MPIYKLEDVETWLTDMSNGQLDLSEDNVTLAGTALALLRTPQPPTMPPPAGNLSPHFTLEEMTHSDTAKAQGIDNTPSSDQTEALAELCNDTLEKIRTLANGQGVTVTSGFRSAKLNAAVGGASDSAHLDGSAADIVIPTFGDPLAVCRAVGPHVAELGIDQLIYETNSGGGVWVHVGRAKPGQKPRGQCFSIVRGAMSSQPFPG